MVRADVLRHLLDKLVLLGGRDVYYKFNGNRPTDAILLLGDNAYPDGTDADYQKAIFEMYPTILKTTPVWSCLGNHDGKSANSLTQSGVYYDIFTLPTQGQAGGVMSGTEAYYSFDYANVHFIALDSHDSDRSPDGAMMQWLKADLAATQRDWIIAFFHHPTYTKGTHDSDKDSDSQGRMNDMRQIFLPVSVIETTTEVDNEETRPVRSRARSLAKTHRCMDGR